MMDWGSAQGFAGGAPAIHHHHLRMGSGPVALAPGAALPDRIALPPIGSS